MRAYIEMRRGINVKTGLLSLLIFVALFPILVPVLLLNMVRLCFSGVAYAAEITSDLIMRRIESVRLVKWFYKKRDDRRHWLRRTGQPIPWEEVKRRLSDGPPTPKAEQAPPESLE